MVSANIQAFLVFGTVLGELSGSRVSDRQIGGRQLILRFFNRTFDLGFTQFTFDENGQRLIHEELSDMDPVTAIFRVSIPAGQLTGLDIDYVYGTIKRFSLLADQCYCTCSLCYSFSSTVQKHFLN